MNPQAKKGRVVTASLLITGTCIGTSFLNIPILTGFAGFIPGVCMSLILWLFTLANGLLYAEATLGNPDGANLFTITRNLIGKGLVCVIAVLYLVNMYVYNSTYYIVGPQFLSWVCEHLFGFTLPHIVGGLLIALLFGAIVYFGIFFASRINFLLIVGFFIAFGLTLAYGSAHLEYRHLARTNWIYIYFAVPILFSAFGFNAIVPSLCTYLQREKRAIQLSLFIGTTVTLITYLIWQWLMIGSVEKGPLWIAYHEGQQITEAFPWIKGVPLLVHVLNFMIFFAAVTSLIALGLALVDFFSDGFNISPEKRRGWKRLLFCLLIFLPPIWIADFLNLTISRVIDLFVVPSSAIVVNGILPIWLVAKARYYYRLSTPHLLPGSKWVLFLMALAIFFLIYLEGVTLIRLR